MTRHVIGQKCHVIGKRVYKHHVTIQLIRQQRSQRIKNITICNLFKVYQEVTIKIFSSKQIPSFQMFIFELAMFYRTSFILHLNESFWLKLDHHRVTISSILTVIYPNAKNEHFHTCKVGFVFLMVAVSILPMRNSDKMMIGNFSIW